MSEDNESKAQNGGDASEGLPPLLAYGVGGDYTGARRVRRAFRRCVLAALVFTGALYFVENFLRYDLVETQYMRALTLEDDSKRAILRNVVRRDAERGETRNQAYVEALAAIEEEDLVLDRYDEAYQINPKNQPLLINYGCRLYHDGQYRRARDTFREASLIQPPRNALPRYLEAAALLASDNSEAVLAEVMALVARANISGDPLRFPQPLWHEHLPTGGRWYRQMQRNVADRCLAPVYAFKSAVLARARNAIEAGTYGEWEARLRELERFGDRLAGAGMEDFSQWTPSQSLAGVLMKRDALALRKALHEARDGVADTVALRTIEESGLETRLDQAWEALRNFEEARERGIEAHAARVNAPLSAAARTFGVLVLLWLAAVFFSKVAGARRRAWAIPYSRGGKIALWGGAAAFFIVLFWMSMAAALNSTAYGFNELPMQVLAGLLLCLAVWGLLNPFVSLPLPGNLAGEDPEERTNARKAYRDAIFVLIRRYFASLLGAFLIACCVWFTVHRLAFSHYPTDKKLSTTGMHEEAIVVMTQVRDLLA